MQDIPHVYIKSHVYTTAVVQVEGKKSHIELHFSTTAENKEAAEILLNEAVAQMSNLVQNHGGRVNKA
jgi:hypothetical protein